MRCSREALVVHENRKPEGKVVIELMAVFKSCENQWSLVQLSDKLRLVKFYAGICVEALALVRDKGGERSSRG